MGTQDISRPFFDNKDPSLLIAELERSSVYAGQGGPTKCSAPAAAVFAALSDTSTWSKWQTVLPKVDIECQPDGTPELQQAVLHHGTFLTLYLHLKPDQPPRKAVGRVVDGIKLPEKPGDSYYITWTAPPTWMHTGRRVWVIEDLGKNGSMIKTVDYQKGPMAYLVSYMVGALLTEHLKKSTEGLARYCEGLRN